MIDYDTQANLGATQYKSGVAYTNAYAPTPEPARLQKAQAIAAEVRARRPEMQVRKIQS